MRPHDAKEKAPLYSCNRQTFSMEKAEIQRIGVGVTPPEASARHPSLLETPLPLLPNPAQVREQFVIRHFDRRK